MSTLKIFTSEYSYFVILSPHYALVDTIAPVVTCPADITVTVQVGTASVAVNFADATATDNSGTVTLTGRTHTSGSSFPVGDTTVIYTFADASSNSASCSEPSLERFCDVIKTSPSFFRSSWNFSAC